MPFFKKLSPRRSKVRKNIVFGTTPQKDQPLEKTGIFESVLLAILFATLCVPILSFKPIPKTTITELISISAIVIIITVGASFYIHHYQRRIIKNHARAIALETMFILLLAVAKLGAILPNQGYWATGTVVIAAIILSIAYNQRFAIGMTTFYCLLTCFTAGPRANIGMFLTMAAGAFTCCLSLKEIRTRMKLLEVGALAAAVVFVTGLALGFLQKNLPLSLVFSNAGYHAIVTFLAAMIIQSLLPIIEKTFRIATSMTLFDYSDANQPLLKKLAMEAPGTYSHSLLVGSIAEAAAEAIARNGLLCRVGAYYHDIGKINKPGYFVENEMGSASRHKELSPAMSQLIIVGHVKDGIEMAREYKLPAVLTQFIERHHGTTLVEYFYDRAKKTKSDEKQAEPSESEFRYTGPKPRTKEAAIVMLADSTEGAVRSLPEITPPKIEAVVHNIAMKRLQDGQFDECELSLRELSQIETAIAKTLAAHYHGRIAYPT
ncbi:MAG: HDIG domain-containing metalloprotein, partial [Planctomycetota bacterium]